MANIRYIANVLNQKGAPAIFEDTFANRPAAGYVGRIFISTDTFVIQRDNGTTWDSLGGGGGSITGTGAAGQVTFWTGASAVSGDNTLFWDNTNKRLGLGTVTPGVRLDIHGTNVLQQLNGTTTNSAFLDFQNAGTTQFRLGNNYNAGTQLFQIIDQTSTTPILTYDRSLSRLSFPAAAIEVLAAGSLTNNGTFSFGIGNTTTLGYIGDRTTIGTRYIRFDRQTALSSEVNIQGINGGVGNAGILMQRDGGNVAMGYSSANLGLSVSGSVYQGTNTANSNYEMFCSGNLYSPGFAFNITTVAVNTTMTRTSCAYVCTTTLTLTLPAVSGLNNQFYVIARTGATVTVQRAGTDTITDKTGTTGLTSVTVAAGTRSMFYLGGGSETIQIF